MKDYTKINSAFNAQPVPSKVNEAKVPASPFDRDQARRAKYLDHLDIAVELTGKLYEAVKDSEDNEQAARSGLQQVANFYCDQITGVLKKVDSNFNTNLEKLNHIHAEPYGSSWPQAAEAMFRNHTKYARQQTLNHIEQITQHEELKKVEDNQLQQIEDMQLQSSARRLIQEVQSRRLRQIEDNGASINKMREENENMLARLVSSYLRQELAADPIPTSWKHTQTIELGKWKRDWDGTKESRARIELNLGVKWSDEASAEFYIKNKLLCAKYLVPTNEVLEPIENRSNRSEESKELLFTLQSMRKLIADVMAMSEEKTLPEHVSRSIDATQIASSSIDANV